MVTLWNDRFSWSGEIPTNYSELNPVALNRVIQGSGDGRYTDQINSSREWQHHGSDSAVFWGRTSGPMGHRMQLNGLDPATEQSRVQLDHFSGLWPNSGRVLIGGWFWQRYIMSFNPLINTRDSDPFVYLSTAASGNPRMQVYSATGALLLDRYETSMPWIQTTAPYFLGFMLDSAGTAQMFSAHSDGRRWVGPERTFDGAANFGATADVEVFSLRSANYYESGFFDEILIAHPSAAFDLEEFTNDLGNGTWANGQSNETDRDYFSSMDIIDSQGIRYNGSTAYSTELGAEEIEWFRRPTFDGFPSSYTLRLSENGGLTWSTPSTLPTEFSGLIRASASITSDEWFSGVEVTIPLDPAYPPEPSHDPVSNTVTTSEAEGVIWSHEGTVTIPEQGITITATPAPGYEFPSGVTFQWHYEFTMPDPPTVDFIPDLSFMQGDLPYVQQLNFTAAAPYHWTISSPSLASVSLDNGQLVVAPTFEVGTMTGSVTLTDYMDQSVTRTFEISVERMTFTDEPPQPLYPHAPILFYDGDEPVEVLNDALAAIVTNEVNGAETFQFTIPASHRLRSFVVNENIVEAAGEKYWIRRVTDERIGNTPVKQVYAEARFYELGTMGGIEPQEWNQVLPNHVMQLALAETEWSVGTVNVGTRRSYDISERTNPLALLRIVQDNHGGDMIFDNTNRVVHLVLESGRDKGVGFFYGSNLTDAKRVVDTSSLVTRIYARNEDGDTIASVNNGLPYVEDYTFTDELKSATYNFKAGTSPYTMLEMSKATLANRSRPDVSYECTVSDLSAVTKDDLDRFASGDYVTVSDPEVGIEGERQRIVALEYDILEPWKSEITLSARLRETGTTSEGTEDSLGTGSQVSTFDLVPFNLLLNSRFDNGLAHWASSGVQVVDSQSGTSDYAVRFEGTGERWIEQTVQPDNRNAYAFSMVINSSGGPSGWVPDVVVEAEVTYEDGEVEVIEVEVGGNPEDAGDDTDQ